MQSETTTAITAVKQDVRLREWAEQLEAQQASGLTVPQWCVENGIKTKSFYYRLRKVREQYIRSAHAAVRLTDLHRSCRDNSALIHSAVYCFRSAA